ncbi:homocysteine S-methyltransferase family protein [Actibacterium sp. 188UL27-1]|nr:homocysteine S-methyltransferase family protein [Actibacterium sp. 188UL27-1]
MLPKLLPHQGDRTFLTDGGLETWLIYQREIVLRSFASFELIATAEGRAILGDYFLPYLNTASGHGMGFISDTPTWRANLDWGDALGYSEAALAKINRNAVEFLYAFRTAQADTQHVLINGVIGPRGDGYLAGEVATVVEAQDYHQFQVDIFAHARVDLVSAITMTNVPEAIGVAQAAHLADVPCVISFTVETDARLPSGQAIGEAIEEVDAQTRNAPAYYMINCAHPDHFADALNPTAPWMERIRGIRANASRLSHAQLQEADHLDDGNPTELGELYSSLSELIPHLSVVGGCCGTDHRHIDQICQALKVAA